MNERFEQLKQQALAWWHKQVLQNANVQQGVNWYTNKSVRDQLIIKVIVALLVVALVWVMIYAPLLKSKNNAKTELENNLTTYNLIASNAGRFGGTSSSGNPQNDSILSAATNQARAKNVNLSRYEQEGANLRVWLERVAFDDAISWLEILQNQYGIMVSQISIDKTDTIGRVDIRATLGR